MITMLYAWYEGVLGMEITLIGYGVCVLAYFSVCFLSRANRAGKGRVLVGWLICEFSCDLLWFVYYFEDGHYVNRGLAGSTACFVLPVVLLAVGLIVTAWNESIMEKQKTDAE